MELSSLLLLAIPLVLLLWLMSTSRKQRRETAILQSSVEVGQEVMTAAGFYGTIVSIDGDIVVLESVPGQPTRWDRRAIVKVVPPTVEDATKAPLQDGPNGPAPASGA